jgi:hypothetical protein
VLLDYRSLTSFKCKPHFECQHQNIEEWPTQLITIVENGQDSPGFTYEKNWFTQDEIKNEKETRDSERVGTQNRALTSKFQLRVSEN